MEMAMIPTPPSRTTCLLGHPVILRSSNRLCSQFSVLKTWEDPTSPKLYFFAPKLDCKETELKVYTLLTAAASVMLTFARASAFPITTHQNLWHICTLTASSRCFPLPR